MNSFNRLVEIFSDFPGIGPRQAKRFVYFLLTRNPLYTKDLIRSLENLHENVVNCSSCFRIFTKNGSSSGICGICNDRNRDHSTLAVVTRDSDLESLEKSGSFNGYYFVLGGVVPILETEPDKKIRSQELLEKIKERLENGLTEVILATSANPESENTADYVSRLLEQFKGNDLKVSTLGRGLSTGTELEYSDSETLKNALKNRG